MNRYIKLTLLLIIIQTSSSFSQTISATVIDSLSSDPIPFATIKYGLYKGVVTNDEGNFTINSSIENIDSIIISSIGYSSKKILPNELTDSIILAPKDIELDRVFVSNKKYTLEEIIENIEDNLEKNYHSDYSKQRFFMRETYSQNMRKFDFEFLKSSIKEVSEELIDSMISLVPRNSSYYNETLGDFYSKPNSENSKMNLIKASKLYDKNNDASGEVLQKRFTEILKNNIKKNSYLKIKSGWFGTKMPVDSIMANVEEKKDAESKAKDLKSEQISYFSRRKRILNTITNNLFFDEDSDLNIIDKSSRYEFTLKGVIDFQDDLAYVITYKPKRSEDFKGTIYVNTLDFAILRMDYENVDTVYKSVFNLLGVNVNHLKYKGIAVFSKDDRAHYSLKYASHTNTMSNKIERPLTIIEKNKHVKGKRKQNELKLDMHINSISSSKKEIVIFETEKVKGSINELTEKNDIEIKYFSKYNADYWKGYDIIEPNQAIKEFKAVEAIEE